VYDAILVELKKERIMDFRTLKASKVKEILKKLLDQMRNLENQTWQSYGDCFYGICYEK
jgi:hypothetical protein